MKVKTISDINNITGRDSRNLRLTGNKVYPVLEIDADCYRVINDYSEPFLYSKDLFEVIDPDYPEDWIRTEYDDDEYYIAPPEFSQVGFFEDYFDGNKKAIEAYEAYLKSVGIKSETNKN